MGFPEKLKTSQKLITVEFSPPKGTDVSKLLEWVRAVQGQVDAINVPDCQRSVLKMSSMAAAKIIQDETGVDTVWQLTCRDRNIIALQADLMGAYALGLRTVLALTGDPVPLGDQKEVAKDVYHLESTRLLDLIKHLNAGMDATGKELKRNGTDFCVGAAINPFRISKPAQQARIRQKLERGVNFFQTQPVYDMEPVERMYEIIRALSDELGIAMPKILVGIIPPKSAESARFMNAHVPGIMIPESVIELLEKSKDPKQEAIHYCAEIVNKIKPLADGFHFMPIGMESRVGALLEQCLALI